jgi:penicillin-binding protein 1A
MSAPPLRAPVLPPPPPPKKKRRKSLVLRLLGFGFAAGMLLFLAGSSVAGYFLWKASKDLPDYEVLAKYEPPIMTRIHAHDGALIAEFARERRMFVPINTVPKLLIGAYLSAEDKHFYQHGGLDFTGIGRAAFNNFKNRGSGKRPEGASTITQQVAKNFLLSDLVNKEKKSKWEEYERKLKEAILSVRIERAFTKDQILELYLNEIFLGAHSYGVAAAALNYFGKKLEELNIQETAYLAALPKGPNNYHPFRKTDAAIGRRNWVIDQMADNRVITRQQAEEAKRQPLGVNLRPFGVHAFAAEYFAEDVRRVLLDMYGEEKLYTGGLSVRTTLDPQMQRMARKALIDGLVAFDRRMGWRGALANIDLASDWGETLGRLDVLTDIEPWRYAVVLEVHKQGVVIGLRPKRLADGSVEQARDKAEIAFEEMKWAREAKGQTATTHNAILGPVPRGPQDVVRVGDVIFVAPVDGKPDRWALMQNPEVRGGLVAMDPHTGRVLAVAGGFSFAESQFDRATQAKRQPGSSFKPLVYAAAIDNGYKPTSVVLDAPIVIQVPGQADWKPHNYSEGYAGPSTLRVGVEKSRNMMTVRLAQDMGMPLVAEYSRRFGVYDDLLPVLSMSLGAGETTVLRMANAYAMLVNGGKQVRATFIDRIQDRYGRTIWRHDERECGACKDAKWSAQGEPAPPEARKQVLDPHTAYQMVSMLEGVVQRGTGYKIKEALAGRPLAGKTGTTNDYKDAWFVGFSPDLVVGVYLGFDTPRSMGKGETGGNVAAPVFANFMKMALAGKPAVPFRQPPGIKLVRVDAKTGLRAASEAGAILEAFKPDEEPDDQFSIIGFEGGEGDGLRPGETAGAVRTGRGLY